MASQADHVNDTSSKIMIKGEASAPEAIPMPLAKSVMARAFAIVPLPTPVMIEIGSLLTHHG